MLRAVLCARTQPRVFDSFGSLTRLQGPRLSSAFREQESGKTNGRLDQHSASPYYQLETRELSRSRGVARYSFWTRRHQYNFQHRVIPRLPVLESRPRRTWDFILLPWFRVRGSSFPGREIQTLPALSRCRQEGKMITLHQGIA